MVVALLRITAVAAAEPVQWAATVLLAPVVATYRPVRLVMVAMVAYLL